jgi:hypothetical protein
MVLLKGSPCFEIYFPLETARELIPSIEGISSCIWIDNDQPHKLEHLGPITPLMTHLCMCLALVINIKNKNDCIVIIVRYIINHTQDGVLLWSFETN